MALAPGIYLIHNLKTNQYIIPVPMGQLPKAHDKVMAGVGPAPVPEIAEIEVSVNSEGLYSFTLVNSDLSIAQSETERCLIWEAGTHLWRITKNDDGFFAWEPLSEQAPPASANDIGSEGFLNDASQCKDNSWGVCWLRVVSSDIAEPVWEFIKVNSIQSSRFNQKNLGQRPLVLPSTTSH